MLLHLVPARSSRRESGILSIPRWITEEVVGDGPDESPLKSAVVVLELFLPSFLEKLLFQNKEPAKKKRAVKQKKQNRILLRCCALAVVISYFYVY